MALRNHSELCHNCSLAIFPLQALFCLETFLIHSYLVGVGMAVYRAFLVSQNATQTWQNAAQDTNSHNKELSSSGQSAVRVCLQLSGEESACQCRR